MFSTPVKPVTSEIIYQAERNALIDQLCATLGTQYSDMRKYREL